MNTKEKKKSLKKIYKVFALNYTLFFLSTDQKELINESKKKIIIQEKIIVKIS